MAGFGEWGGISDPNIYDVRATWLAAGSQCSTGFQLRTPTASLLGPEGIANIGDDVFNHTSFLGNMMPADALLKVDAVNIVSKEGFTISYSGTVGTAGGTEAASALMVPATLVGGIRSKLANGRMFLPVRPILYTNINDLSTIGNTGLQAFITHLADVTNVGDTVGSVFLTHAHEAKPARPKKKGGTLPAVPARWYDITAITLNRRLSWLSSRKAGQGS